MLASTMSHFQRGQALAMAEPCAPPPYLLKDLTMQHASRSKPDTPPSYPSAEEPQTSPTAGSSSSSGPSPATLQSVLTGMRNPPMPTKKKNVSRAPVSLTEGSGMSRLFNKKHIELSMTLSDNLVFVYPNAGTRHGALEDQSGDDPAAQIPKQPCFLVNLTLSVPANASLPAKAIDTLTVNLVANESLGFPDGPFEYNNLTYVTKVVEEASGLVPEPGQSYQFQVLIDVPNSVTPFECNRFGRVLPKVKAKLHWQGARSRLVGGPKDLVAEQDIWIMSVPRTSNILDYARTHQSAIEHLGPVIVHVRTQHLVVGGYLRMGLSLPAPAPGCKVERVTLTIVQTTTLQSRSKSERITKCLPDRITFMRIDGDRLKESIQTPDSHNAGSVPLLGNWVARLPSDSYCRPSTLKGSEDSMLRIAHMLEIRVFFTPANAEATSAGKPAPMTVYSASWPITLASCACRWPSLKLPTYSERDPCPVNDAAAVVAEWQDKRARAGRRGVQGMSSDDHSLCSCGVGLDELLRCEKEQDGEQQTSAIRLLEQEIAAASITSPSPRMLPQDLRTSSEASVQVQPALIDAYGRRESASALRPVRSTDDEHAIDGSSSSEAGPGGWNAWARWEEAEQQRLRIEQKASQAYVRDPQ